MNTAPIILDIEASGFGRSGYPIEIGYALPDGQTWCSLIRPEPEWTHWDPGAEAVHHISQDLLPTRGRYVREVASLINQNLGGKTAYSDGWGHDYSWLGRLFDAANMTPNFKLENLRALLSEEEADLWHIVKDQVKQDRGPQRHRASADARLLQLTWQRLKEGERQVSERVEKNLRLSIVSNEFLPVGTHSHPRFWPMAAHA
jgi:hypothetical protein